MHRPYNFVKKTSILAPIQTSFYNNTCLYFVQAFTYDSAGWLVCFKPFYTLPSERDSMIN
jgi:Zn-finger protein